MGSGRPAAARKSCNVSAVSVDVEALSCLHCMSRPHPEWWRGTKEAHSVWRQRVPEGGSAAGAAGPRPEDPLPLLRRRRAGDCPRRGACWQPSRRESLALLLWLVDLSCGVKRCAGRARALPASSLVALACTRRDAPRSGTAGGQRSACVPLNMAAGRRSRV